MSERERTQTVDCIRGEAIKEETLWWESLGRITRILERMPLSNPDCASMGYTMHTRPTEKCVTLL